MTVDCIMLSYCKSDVELEMTRDAIRTLRSSCPHVHFNLIVVETSTDTIELDAKVIQPVKDFNYNAFLHIGYKELKSDSDYLLILNNDLIFQPNFVYGLIWGLNYCESVSPWNPGYALHEENYQDEINFGFRTAYQLCGWALMMRKSLFKKIPFDQLFPSDLKFWFQDNYYAYQLQKYKLNHALIKRSKVIHLESKSHHLLKNASLYTEGQRKIYEDKIRRSL